MLSPWGKPDSTKTLPSTLNQKFKYSDRRVLEIDSMHKLDLGMKLAISSMPYKDRFTAEQVNPNQLQSNLFTHNLSPLQVAFCLDDIIKSVESGKDSINRKVENLVIKERKKEEEQKEEDRRRQSLKLKKNHEFVISRAKTILEENAEKEAEKKKEEEKKKEDEAKAQKKRDSALTKFWKEKKDVSEAAKNKKQEEAKKLQEDKKAEDKANREKRDKEFNDFQKKQVEKLQEDFKQIRDKDKKVCINQRARRSTPHSNNLPCMSRLRMRRKSWRRTRSRSESVVTSRMLRATKIVSTSRKSRAGRLES